MNRKKLFVTGMATLCVLGVPAAAGAQGKVPESIQFEEAAHLIPGLGSTYDAAAALEISGDDANEEIIFSTYDDSVAEVSGEGVITATGYGVTTIIATSAADETVSASMDVAVYDLFGTYSGVKKIEAMGCDVAVDIVLKEDGTYSYYRAPMEVALNGGGEMPALEAEGKLPTGGAATEMELVKVEEEDTEEESTEKTEEDTEK